MPFCPPRAALAAALALALSAPPARAADGVSDLLGWLPARTNLAVFVDADKLRNTELGKKKKWATGKRATTGLDAIPPGVTRLAVGAEYAPGAGLNWEVLVVGLKKKITDDELASGTGGKKTALADRTAVVTPRHGLAANLAPQVVGAYQPPNRQEAARWLRAADGKVSPHLSPYLKLAAAGVSANSPIVLALDATDMFDPALVEAKLAAAKSFKGKEALVKPVAKLFGEMRGLTLTVRVTDKVTGQVRLEFNQPADPLRTVAKPLLLEVFERLGIDSDEMAGWTAAVKGNDVTLAGELSEDGVREILAPFLRPSVSALDQTEQPAAPAADDKAQKSLKYYEGVRARMKEVRKSQNPTFEKLASRFNVAARNIDDLPILGVDEELLDWGHAIATTFRSMAIVAQTAGGMMTLAEANSAMAVVSTPNYYTASVGGARAGPYGGYGWGATYTGPSGTATTSTVSNFGAVNNVIAMTGAQEADYRRKTWQNIDSATNEVRRKMVKKYGVEFP